MEALQPGSAVPLYRQTAEFLRSRIRQGQFKTGERIPSEAQLCQLLGVSRITVRQAISELEREGLLKRVPGKGTFIQLPTRLERLTALTGFGENVVARGLDPGYHVLRIGTIVAPPDVAQRLALLSTEAFLVSRVLLASGQPVGVHTSYLPPWVLRHAPHESFTEQSLSVGSLYRAIKEAGIDLKNADEVVEPAIATREEARYLDMDEGGLVLRVTRTTYDTLARPIEYVLLTYRPGLYSYRVTLHANEKSVDLR